MKHKGKAAKANLRILTLAAVITLALVLLALGLLPSRVAGLRALAGFVFLFGAFAVFCFNFFRDPDAKTTGAPKAIVSPAHGKVDFIGQAEEKEFFLGPCQRISIFLSVFDVHIQNTPVSGKVVFLKHSPGQFLNALKLESAAHNENVLIGIASSERPLEKIGVRLITGLIARRIIPWIANGDDLDRGQRVSLIQFGSRVDLYLPLDTKVLVKLGDRVVGGETIMAERT